MNFIVVKHKTLDLVRWCFFKKLSVNSIISCYSCTIQATMVSQAAACYYTSEQPHVAKSSIWKLIGQARSATQFTLIVHFSSFVQSGTITCDKWHALFLLWDIELDYRGTITLLSDLRANNCSSSRNPPHMAAEVDWFQSVGEKRDDNMPRPSTC